MGVLGLRQINTCRTVPLKINFLDDEILHCLLLFLFFYAYSPRKNWRHFCLPHTRRRKTKREERDLVNMGGGGGGVGNSNASKKSDLEFLSLLHAVL
jgi:hypothetical protein